MIDYTEPDDCYIDASTATACLWKRPAWKPRRRHRARRLARVLEQRVRIPEVMQ